MEKSIFSRAKRRRMLAAFLCVALLITAIPLRASAAGQQKDVTTRANVVLFAYFSDETDTDWFNKISEDGYTDNNTKGMTNVQRYINYYDGSQNRSFSTYMSKISGGTYAVKNIFPQYDTNTGKVTPLKLSKTQEVAQKGKCDSQIVSELEKAIDLSSYKDQLDLDGDDVIDNVSIVLQGADSTDAGSTMRSHKFATYEISEWNGTNLRPYTFNMLNTTALNNKRAGLISHEYLHSLNYPDLYRQTDGDYPVGNWDIMSGDGRFMTYPLAYLRMAISGWAKVPDIAEVGKNPTTNKDQSTTYDLELETISDTNLDNAVMITSPVNPYEKFVIEVREKPADYYNGDTLDAGIPKSGVIVYRVDTTVGGFSNFDGKTGVYVFGPRNGKIREDAALDAANPSYGSTDLSEKNNVITYSDGTNTGIKVSDVGNIQNGKVSLKVTVPDWSSLDAWKDTTGVKGESVSLVDLNDKSTAVVQDAQQKDVKFYEYTNGKWTDSSLPDLEDSNSIYNIKLISFKNKIFASYVDIDGKGHVKVLEGNSWKDVVDQYNKSVGVVSSNQLDIGVAGDQLYISYVLNYRNPYARKITVEDGVIQLGDIMSVANPTASGNYISSPRILEQKGNLVIAYRDDDDIKLKKYDGTSAFTTLADAGQSSSYDVITYNQELYFVSASASELTVKKYNAAENTWKEYASDAIDSDSPKLAVAQGNLYVVTGPATSGKTGVYVYEVTEGKLTKEGLAVDSGVNGTNYSMIASGDTLLIGYREWMSGNAVIKEKTISNALLSLTITPPDKVSYTVGDEMSLKGLKVTANYQKNTRELKEGEYTVTGFGTEENGKLIAKTLGEQTATVTLKSDTNIKNTFTFLVSEVPSITSITSVKNNGTVSKDFVYGDKMDVTVETTGADGKKMALYYRKSDGALTKLTEPVTVKDGTPVTFSYDTTKKILPTGENLRIAVCSVDDDSVSVKDSTEISLAKKKLTASITGTLDKTYDGTTTAPKAAALSLDGVLNQEASASGTIEYGSPDAKNQTLSVKNFKVDYVSGADDYYITPEAPTKTGTIRKAAAPQTSQKYLTVSNNTKYNYSYDLNQLLPSLSGVQKWGGVSYELQKPIALGDYYKDGAEIKDGKLTLPIEDVSSTAETEIGTIKITVKSSNFEDFTVLLAVKSSNRKIPAGTVTTQGTLTYGQALNNLKITANMIDPDSKTAVAGTITWKDGSIVPNAGKYQAEWRFVPNDSAYAEITGTKEIQVDRKSVTVTFDMEGTTTKTYDGTVSLPKGAKINVKDIKGILDKDDVTVSNQFTAAYASADAGTKKIVVSGLTLTGSARQNYKLETPAALEVETGITKANPKKAKDITCGKLEEGKPLSSISLSGSFTGVDDEVLEGTLSWKDPDAAFNAGTHTAKWVFTPKSANYAPIEGSIEITVEKKNDSSDEPSTDKPSEDKPSTDKPSEDRPSTEKPSEEKPSTEKPSEDEPSTEKPSGGEASTEQSGTGRPGEKPATTEKKKTEEKKNTVKAGDEADPARLILLLVLSLLSMGIFVFIIKRENAKK